jgi:hypothetical protein
VNKCIGENCILGLFFILNSLKLYFLLHFNNNVDKYVDKSVIFKQDFF